MEAERWSEKKREKRVFSFSFLSVFFFYIYSLKFCLFTYVSSSFIYYIKSPQFCLFFSWFPVFLFITHVSCNFVFVFCFINYINLFLLILLEIVAFARTSATWLVFRPTQINVISSNFKFHHRISLIQL